MPADKPSSVLVVKNGQYYPDTFGIAFGPDGYLYVGSYDGPGYTVRVYPPDASGPAIPLRTLNVPFRLAIGYGGVALDAQDFLYIGGTMCAPACVTPTVDVFTPGAHGNEPPIQRIDLPVQGLGDAVAVDRSGRLFVTVGSSRDSPNIFVYDDPTSSPKLERTICFYNGKTFLAFDQYDELLAASGGARNDRGGVTAVPDSVRGCPVQERRHIAPVGAQIYVTDGIAAKGNLLYALLRTERHPRSRLFVLDLRRGLQEPIAVRRFRNIDPTLVLVGP
jgi:hypothetical protein